MSDINRSAEYVEKLAKQESALLIADEFFLLVKEHFWEDWYRTRWHEDPTCICTECQMYDFIVQYEEIRGR